MRYLFLIMFSFLLSCTNSSVTEVDKSEYHIYKNHHDSVAYVGKETCKTCHFDIYKSFIETGMGQSFSINTKLNQF